MNIEKNINKIKKEVPKSQLIVVTKKQSLENINKVYKFGEREFGENKVQDILQKKEKLPSDIKWHMIGHLQTNKVKFIAPFIHMIQSVDSIKLLEKIDLYSERNNRKINCLIQVKVAKEDSKYGFSTKDAQKLLSSNYQDKYSNTNIKGIMGMSSFTNDPYIIKNEFIELQNIFNNIQIPNKVLSIGMSNDYKIAATTGSNMIRIGSAIFK
ncbi:MAG: YggS family pyridoxal phosphate-dependent enzyme [Flavobacteriales bacterium]|nr:YggS family pyridoxal phosphate-dependent enzyme [Flavobacteriales bacterium]|tara:strand:- start:7996 stop:8628 length:633 start_codon:yes stop_codon:yes gene_type:complete